MDGEVLPIRLDSKDPSWTFRGSREKLRVFGVISIDAPRF